MKYSNFSACPYLKEKLLITFSLGWPNCHYHALPQTIYHAMASNFAHRLLRISRKSLQPRHKTHSSVLTSKKSPGTQWATKL